MGTMFPGVATPCMPGPSLPSEPSAHGVRDGVGGPLLRGARILEQQRLCRLARATQALHAWVRVMVG